MENLNEFKKHIEQLAGEWDGDNPGRLEDQAHICSDILDKVKEIEVLLDELKNN